MARRVVRRAKPGEGTIIRKTGKRKSGGDGLHMEVNIDLSYDFNAVKAIDHISTAVAEHNRESLKAGQHPTGGAMRPLSKKSLDENRYGQFRHGGVTFFNNSGESLDHFFLGPIKGSSMKASRWLKPVTVGAKGSPGEYDFMINRWLAQGIDLQGVTGKVAEVIQKATDEFLAGAIGPADQIKTPENEDRAQYFIKDKQKLT